ncbi:helix-turn-helix domain-containing protein [Pyxidicoccus sp. 3LG]
MATCPGTADRPGPRWCWTRGSTSARGGRTVSLAKRVLPRRLLYALARQPGRTVSKEACVRAMWDAEHDPRLHDNALRVHVRHVREMLEGTGLRVVFEDPGYRLEVSEGFSFVRDEPGSP